MEFAVVEEIVELFSLRAVAEGVCEMGKGRRGGESQKSVREVGDHRKMRSVCEVRGVRDVREVDGLGGEEGVWGVS